MLDAGDFNILPTVTGDDDCHVTITHRWTGRKWEWRGKEADWPDGRDRLLLRIDLELNPRDVKEISTAAGALP